VGHDSHKAQIYEGPDHVPNGRNDHLKTGAEDGFKNGPQCEKKLKGSQQDSLLNGCGVPKQSDECHGDGKRRHDERCTKKKRIAEDPRRIFFVMGQFSRENRIQSELDEGLEEGKVNVNEAELAVALASEGSCDENAGEEVDEVIEKFTA